jgi:hypothetical protein
MKKIALVLVLGLLLQVPATVMASDGPPPKTSSAVLLGAAVVTSVLVFFGGAAATAGASAKKSGNEFADLNNNGSFKTLLNQVAGGSLNTLDILK